jgi:hypothetical protein
VRRALGLLLWIAAGCGRGVSPSPSADASVPIRHSVTAQPPQPPPVAEPPPDGPPAPARGDAGASVSDEALRAEPRERDPRSETVKLKLTVTPATAGVVLWGRKKLAELKPGQMTAEIERPRGSGTLDVLIRTPLFLPHHVRLFTDRDDRLSVRLIRPEDAHALLGYRRAAPRPTP